MTRPDAVLAVGYAAKPARSERDSTVGSERFGLIDRALRLAVGQSRVRNARPTSVEGAEEKGLTIPLDGSKMVYGCQKASFEH